MTAIAMQEPILTAVCREPEGTFVREVRPLAFDRESLRRFWELARQFKYLFATDISGDFKKFCELIVSVGPDGFQSNGLFWVIDDFVGVFYMTDIKLGRDAKVHYTFFDRRHFGRVDLTREMLRYVFSKYNFRRLTAEIPYYSSQHAFSFISTLGFKKEGRRRKAAWHNDDWFDVALFGILKEEALAR